MKCFHTNFSLVRWIFVGNWKPKKTRNSVTPREWRADLLGRLLRFSRSGERRAGRLTEEANYLIRWTFRSGAFSGVKGKLSLDTCRWMQRKAAEVIDTLARGQQWELRLKELYDADPQLEWFVTPGHSQLAANTEATFLLTLKDILTDPANAGRIRRCAQPGCNTLFIKRKTGQFCAIHATPTEKVRRYRAKFSSAEIEGRRWA